MTKRSLILIVLAAILIIAAIVSIKTDFQPKSEKEPEPDQGSEPGQEKFTGGRKGFYYDRNLKRYVKAKDKTGSEDQKEPYPGMVKGEIIDPGESGEI